MHEIKLWCGPNDGGIKRGDSAETGDEQAQRTETIARDGYGLDTVTGDSDLEDLSVFNADDPSLGLTNRREAARRLGCRYRTHDPMKR